MNNRRRKDLKDILVEIEKSKNDLNRIKECIKGSMDSLECVKTDEEEAFSNLPESLQCSERANEMEDAISELEDALSYDNDIKDEIENIVSYLEEAVTSIKKAME